jgi:hypothetical protein
MQRRIIAAGVVSVVAVALVYSGQDAARALVERGIQAMGGADKLARFKAVTWVEKGRIFEKGKGYPYIGMISLQWPDQFRMEVKDFLIVVLNRDKGWIKDQKGGTKEMSKEELALQKRSQRAGWITTLQPLHDMGYRLKSLGEINIDGKPAHGVQVSHKDAPDVKLYFDKKTRHLVKSEYRSKLEPTDKKETKIEVFYSDFRDVDGAIMYHKFVLKHDDVKYIEAELLNMKARGRLEDKVFAKPG